MANLVIVESPAKASTIKNYLGSNYKVVASVGHVRDLPKSSLGIDIENNFEPHYINIRGKGDIIKNLKKEAKNASKIYLATDPDREGEAISWHLATALNIPVEKTKRITFNEVTKTAVKSAIKESRTIDMDLVNSQQARRILDRIVGYKLSPFLWKTVRSGLSAGRVQSVATRIIVERENEIRSFVADEYWTIEAELKTGTGSSFCAHFVGNEAGKIELVCADDANKVVNEITGKDFKVKSVKKSVRYRNPAPPFTTSTLQQEASRKLGFQSQRIMRVAQELYEGINLGSEFGGVHGLITYMRTDSQRISSEAQAAATKFITDKYGAEYCPSSPRVYRSKANSQDAHEAIRPSIPELTPELMKNKLSSDQYKLYKLIWSRFIASQMASAALDTVSIDVINSGYLFKANGSVVTFPGFMAVYDYSDENEVEETKGKLPKVAENELLSASKISPEQHFTEPPPRYNEASLVKFLEEKGIGRPSTYTPIITTIIARGYVARDGKSLKPTPLGEVTTDIMVKNFPDIVDYTFTAQMENQLDSIADGSHSISDVIGGFYDGFKNDLETAENSMPKDSVVIPDEKTDIICDKCGATMILKSGRYGKFAACPNYPECKNTKPLTDNKASNEKEKPKPEKTDIICDKCGAEMLKRKGPYGEFYACSKYPECKNTKQILQKLGVPCPICGSETVVRYGKNRSVFYSCEKYPDCTFTSWDQPLAEKCPKCGKTLYLKKAKHQIVCAEKNCGYKRDE